MSLPRGWAAVVGLSDGAACASRGCSRLGTAADSIGLKPIEMGPSGPTSHASGPRPLTDQTPRPGFGCASGPSAGLKESYGTSCPTHRRETSAGAPIHKHQTQRRPSWSTHVSHPTPHPVRTSDQPPSPCPSPRPSEWRSCSWTARMGAVTAEALADREGVTVASARARLGVLKKAGWLSRRRPLAEQPALYTATRAGMRVSGLRGLDPCRVSASNAHHLIVCAARRRGAGALLSRSPRAGRARAAPRRARAWRAAGERAPGHRIGRWAGAAPSDLVLWPEIRGCGEGMGTGCPSRSRWS